MTQLYIQNVMSAYEQQKNDSLLISDPDPEWNIKYSTQPFRLPEYPKGL